MNKDGFTFNALKINAGSKITIVAARWNAQLVDAMVKSASNHLIKLGCKNLTTVYVPGAWELAYGSQKALENSDGVIAFGVVIRGETSHYELISESAAQGLMQVSLNANKPIAFGLIAAESFEQAKQRSDPSQLDKGKEVAQSLVEMMDQ